MHTPILAIVGPTASGKSSLALAIARLVPSEIVSADSRQVYRGLDIGTAKPSKAEQAQIQHYFIDILDPPEDYSAGLFGVQARTCVRMIIERRKLPLLVGGSGLYVKSVVDGLFNGPGKDVELRKRLEQRYASEGERALRALLESVDPESAARIEAGKPRRMIRALEVYYETGRTLSAHHSDQNSEPDFEVVQIGMRWKRDDLYRCVNERVEKMLNQGLIDEVQSLKHLGYDDTLNALNTVGYKEVFAYLRGQSSREEMVELIKRNTRRFAKRQMTWFGADKRIEWIDLHPHTDFAELAARLVKKFGERFH